MKLTPAEKETTIRWDRESPTASVFSADPVVWRKLARLGIEPTKTSTIGGEEVGRFYATPLSRLRWGLKRGTPRPRREAQATPARPPTCGPGLVSTGR